MEKKEIKVSVVIPVYNVEPYVESAVRSIISQTLREIEIVIVNDGSKDNSLEIVQKLASEDERIKIISTSNHGLSIARNLGFYHSAGKYVLFFDSDDFLEEDALELCYKKCEENSLDFLFFDADVFCDDEATSIDKDRFNYKRAYLYEDAVYSGIDILEKQMTTNGYRSSACLSFIKADYLTKIRLLFYPYILHEDELFTIQLYLKANRVGLINRTFFHRRLRGNSIMTTSYSKRNAIGILTVCRELKKYYLEYGRTQSERKLLKKDISTLFSALWINVNRYLGKPEQDYLSHVFSHEFARYLNVRTFLRIKYPRLFLLLSSIKRKLK